MMATDDVNAGADAKEMNADQSAAGQPVKDVGAEAVKTLMGDGASDNGVEAGGKDQGSRDASVKDGEPDWRADLAGDDEDVRKALARYQTPKAVAKALADLRKRISAGSLKPGLPENATQADLAAWRKENGIPEKPDGYAEALPATMKLSDEDKAAFGDFAAAMHAENAPPKVVAKAMEWYAQAQEKAAEARAIADREAQQRLDDELSEEWGGEKRANVNLADRYLAAELGDGRFALYSARLPDGTALGNHPQFVKLMAKIASEMDGGVGLVRGDGGSVADIDKRLAELTAMQNSKDAAERKKFWSPEIQNEQLELISRKEKLSARNAKAA